MIIQKESLRQRLMGATVASCECATKTPVIEFHDEKCLYRILVEATVFVERSSLQEVDLPTE